MNANSWNVKCKMYLISCRKPVLYRVLTIRCHKNKIFGCWKLHKNAVRWNYSSTSKHFSINIFELEFILWIFLFVTVVLCPFFQVMSNYFLSVSTDIFQIEITNFVFIIHIKFSSIQSPGPKAKKIMDFWITGISN